MQYAKLVLIDVSPHAITVGGNTFILSSALMCIMNCMLILPMESYFLYYISNPSEDCQIYQIVCPRQSFAYLYIFTYTYI